MYTSTPATGTPVVTSTPLADLDDLSIAVGNALFPPSERSLSMTATEDQTFARIGELAARDDVPPACDATMATLIAQVAAAIYGRVEDEDYAVLCGISASLLRRHHAALPAPAYRDEDGSPFYSVEQLAAHFGASVEKTKEIAERVLTEDPDGRYVRLIDVSKLTSVQ